MITFGPIILVQTQKMAAPTHVGRENEFQNDKVAFFEVHQIYKLKLVILEAIRSNLIFQFEESLIHI